VEGYGFTGLWQEQKVKDWNGRDERGTYCFQVAKQYLNFHAVLGYFNEIIETPVSRSINILDAPPSPT
jgi:hypothetical protein